jgi:acyl carrier protein
MEQLIGDLQAIIRRATRMKKKDAEVPVNVPLNEIVTSSLQFVIILGEIERQFQVNLPDDFLDPTRIPDVTTIAGIIARLQERQPARA